MNGLFYTPARNYDGKVLCRVVGHSADTRGQTIVQVQALNGSPWDDAGMWGFTPTSHRWFYPEQLVPADEKSEDTERNEK